MASKMYADVKTWNPFRGCRFSCSYCVPSFKAQAKRQVHNCARCAAFEPHEHPERLTNIPNAKTIFICGNGDISFCSIQFLTSIVYKTHRYPERTFYWQSKNPRFLHRLITLFDDNNNHILLTTIETNRDKDYHLISKAPCPTDRAYDFMQLPWPRKIVTIEPIMAFDHDQFLRMICDIKPEMVYLGYNSHYKSAPLPQPAPGKTILLINGLRKTGIPVTTKYLPWEK